MKPPPDETARLAKIRRANQRLKDAQADLDAAIVAARRGQPVTWEKIGAVLGVSPQAAHDRFKRRRAARQQAS